MLDLDAIRARTAAASPGPWQPDVKLVRRGGRGGVHSVEQLWVDSPGRCVCNVGLAEYAAVEHDAVFIAHAREDVPALIAEVERLREREKNLTGAYETAWAHHEERVRQLNEAQAEVELLRAAMERIVAWYGERGIWAVGDEPLGIAREALGGTS